VHNSWPTDEGSIGALSLSETSNDSTEVVPGVSRRAQPAPKGVPDRATASLAPLT